MATLILSFLAGIGITIAILFMIFGLVISCAGFIAILRAAINNELSTAAKIIWIIGCFIPGVAFFYFAFVDKNGFLKFTGWICIIFTVLVAASGGAAMNSAVEAFKNDFKNGAGSYEWHFKTLEPQIPEKSPENSPEQRETPDDSPLSL